MSIGYAHRYDSLEQARAWHDMTKEDLIKFLDCIAEHAPDLLTEALKRKAARIGDRTVHAVANLFDQWHKITGKKG